MAAFEHQSSMHTYLAGEVVQQSTAHAHQYGGISTLFVRTLTVKLR